MLSAILHTQFIHHTLPVTFKMSKRIGLWFNSPTHLYLFVAIGMYNLKMQRDCFQSKFNRSNYRNTARQLRKSVLILICIAIEMHQLIIFKIKKKENISDDQSKTKVQRVPLRIGDMKLFRLITLTFPLIFFKK